MTDTYFFAFAVTMALVALAGLVVWLVERSMSRWPREFDHPSFWADTDRRPRKMP